MFQELQDLVPFRCLDRAALASVERHTNRLRLPEQRWLHRRGQPLDRELFLVEGTVAVRSEQGVRRLSAKATAGDSLNAYALGAAEIATVTPVEVLAVDMAPIRHLLDAPTSASIPQVSLVEDWMNALLQGPIMRWFPPSVWARLLRAGELCKVEQGELIVARGEVAAAVFVVAEGVATSAGERFGPGGFFAEESALMQQPARHDAIMETAGALVSFSRTDILDLLAEYVAPQVEAPYRVDLDAASTTGTDAIPTDLEPPGPVALRGGDVARRLVVAAKLMRRGFTLV